MCAARTDQRDRVFKTALELIREKGPQGASVRAICKRAGMTPPTLYHHFGSLAGLHRAVAEAVFAQALLNKAGEASDDALTEIERGWDAYVGFARDEPNLFAVMNNEILSAALTDDAKASLALLEANFERLASEKTLRFTPEVAAQMTWAAAHGVACLASAMEHGFHFSQSAADAVKRAVIDEILG